MDTKSKILILLLIVAIVGVTAWKYYAYIVRQDFIVYDQIACDPAMESCFAYICEEGDEECDDTPFKKIEKNGVDITLCANYQEGECEPLSCAETDTDCSEITCSEETLEEGEICVEEEIEENETELESNIDENAV